MFVYAGEIKMSIRARITKRRENKLKKRVAKEVYIFPKKNERALNDLIKKVEHKKPKSIKKQMDEWKEFMERMK